MTFMLFVSFEGVGEEKVGGRSMITLPPTNNFVYDIICLGDRH